MVPRSQLIYKDFFTGLISENRRLISDFFYFTKIDPPRSQVSDGVAAEGEALSHRGGTRRAGCACYTSMSAAWCRPSRSCPWASSSLNQAGAIDESLGGFDAVDLTRWLEWQRALC